MRLLITLTCSLCIAVGRLCAQTVFGIDVSHFQGTINWSQVAASGKVYAWAKSTEGVTYDDPNFSTYLANGTSAGVIMGAYHFARPDNNAALAEANHFLSVASGAIGACHLPPVLDLEDPAAANSGLSFSALSSWVQTWMTTVQNATGVQPILYTSGYYAANLSSSLHTYKLWIADPDGCPTCAPGIGAWPSWAFKQYSWTGTVSGISGAVDLDVFNGTAAAFNTLVGCGGGCTPPANDVCSSGVPTLVVGTSCSYTSGDIYCANQSYAASGCPSGLIQDVWYRFTVTSSGSHTVRVDPSSSMDAVVELRQSSCTGTVLGCIDIGGGPGAVENLIHSLSNGTYYVRVYDFNNAGNTTPPATTSFDICVIGPGGGSCPDPTISSLTFDPPNPTAGQDVDFDIVIENEGTASTVAADDPRIEYWVNGVYTGFDDDETTVLGPGDSSTESLTNYVFSAPGTYTVCAILDPYPNECPTNNNTTCAQITVQAACPVPAVPTPSFGSASCPGPSLSATIPLEWNPVPGAAGYSLRVGIYPYEEGIFVDVGAGDCYPGTSYSLPIALFTTGIPCYWSVSAYGECGNDACQSAYSSPRYFNVPPVVLAPNGTTICAGGSAELSLETFWVVDAPGTNSAQWYRDGLAIPGATGGTYSATQAGGYSVVLTFTGSLWCTDPVVLGPSNIIQVVEHNLDTDGDGVPNCSDNCPNVAGQIGSACNDGNACTTNDQINGSCGCVGTPVADADSDGLCDVIDPCPMLANVEPGDVCSDGDVCTTNDQINGSCGCAGTPVADTDSDGLCDVIDPCPTLANFEPSDACDDGDACTSNDQINGSCGCAGVPAADTDSDGLCDAIDPCLTLANIEPGDPCDDGDACTTNDQINGSCGCSGTPAADTDSDGLCDAIDPCPTLANIEPGDACDDGDVCTTNDEINGSCGCAGTPAADTDSDGLCDAIDPCPTLANIEPGDACSDGNTCTINDQINASCACVGTLVGDADDDGLCDVIDPCPTLANFEPGDACDDGDPCTNNDAWSTDCVCEGDPLTVPGSPVGITGPASAGTGTIHSFTTNLVTDATSYLWNTIPADWNGSSTSTSIAYTVGTVPAQVCVRALTLDCLGDSICVWVYDIGTWLPPVSGGSGWFTVFPNPSNGIFQITPAGLSAGAIDIRVFDGLGQLVGSPVILTGSQPQRLDLHEKANGIYFLRATRGNECRVLDLVLQR